MNTNKNEMEQFLCIHIMAGIVNMPSCMMYWADMTRFDPTADVMSRNQFYIMRNYFHINDNNTMKAYDDPEYDKFFKVRPFVDSIKSCFREIEVEDSHHLPVRNSTCSSQGRENNCEVKGPVGKR